MKLTCPYGPFLLFVCLLLAVAFSLPSYGAEITIPENEWQNFKEEFALLRSHNVSLQASLDNSQLIVTGLESNLATLWLDLNQAKSESVALSWKLKEAEKRAAQLGSLLTESENGLTALRRSIRREKGKAYLIGGAVGLAVGITAGVVLGLAMGG